MVWHALKKLILQAPEMPALLFLQLGFGKGVSALYHVVFLSLGGVQKSAVDQYI